MKRQVPNVQGRTILAANIPEHKEGLLEEQTIARGQFQLLPRQVSGSMCEETPHKPPSIIHCTVLATFQMKLLIIQ